MDTDEAANAVSLLEDLDMGGLHRCCHVHALLGDLQVCVCARSFSNALCCGTGKRVHALPGDLHVRVCSEHCCMFWEGERVHVLLGDLHSC